MTKTQIALAAAAALLAGGQAHAFLIDDFDDTQYVFTTLPGTPVASGTVLVTNPTATALTSASRDVWISSTGGSGMAEFDVNNGSGAGVLSAYTQSNGFGNAAIVSIVWDAAGDPVQTGSSGASLNLGHLTTVADLTDGGLSNLFRFTAAKDEVNYNFDLAVYEGGASPTATINFNTGGALGPTIVDLPFSLFNLGTALPTDFDAVTAIVLTINAQAAADYQILRLETTVPVPATLALFGLGLVGMGWSARRSARRA
jgi:hypothetical protein